MTDLTRRGFLLRGALAATGVATLAPWLTRCGGSGDGGRDARAIEQQAASYDPSLDCTNTTGLWPAEMQTRDENEYADRSPHPDQFCFDCTNFIPPPEKNRCGGCDTVKGPINPIGWCKAFTRR